MQCKSLGDLDVVIFHDAVCAELQEQMPLCYCMPTSFKRRGFQYDAAILLLGTERAVWFINLILWKRGNLESQVPRVIIPREL